MKIRIFRSTDADFCFKIRSKAFIQKFYNELGPVAVAAGIKAYLPDDYIRLAEKMKFFIVEEKNAPVGFFTIKRWDATTAEIPLIYIDLNHLGSGIGKACLCFCEEWLSSNWSEVRTLIVDTIIPKYNSGKYKKMGFKATEETFCEFPDLKVKALRLCKKLNT